MDIQILATPFLQLAEAFVEAGLPGKHGFSRDEFGVIFSTIRSSPPYWLSGFEFCVEVFFYAVYEYDEVEDEVPSDIYEEYYGTVEVNFHIEDSMHGEPYVLSALDSNPFDTERGDACYLFGKNDPKLIVTPGQQELMFVTCSEKPTR